MAEYRYITYDILSGATLAELPFADVTYNYTLNRAGSFSGTLPLFGVDAVTPEALSAGKHGIVVERDGVIVWNGILWTLEVDVVAQRIRAGAEGTWSYFGRRFIRPTEPYGDLYTLFQRYGYTGPNYYDADPLVIAREAVSYVQQEDLFGKSANIGVVVDKQTSPARVEDYTINENGGATPMQVVEELASHWEHGFDFRIDAYWNGASIAKRMVMGHRHLGRETDEVYELGRNVVTISASVDATRSAGFTIGSGAGSGLNQLIAYYAVPDYSLPLYESAVAWREVEDDTRLAWLTIARANKQKVPLYVPRITTTDALDPQIHDMVIGDEVTVRADAGYLQLDGRYRMMTIDISPGNDGMSTVRIDLAPSELFDE